MGYEEAKDIATRQHITGNLQRKEESIARELGTKDMAVVREFILHMQELESRYEAENNKY